MFTLLTILIFIASILLILVVLVQPGKGDMISGMSGLGGQFNQVLGTRKAADFLTKLTVGLAAAIMILSLMTNLFFVGHNVDDVRKAPTEGQQTEQPQQQPIQPNELPPPPGQ